jgi:predicted dehydrogenase
MVACCEQAGVKLGVVVPAQADPRFDELRRLVREDFFGALVLVHATSAEDTVLQSPPPAAHWRRDPKRAGSGVLRQIGTEALHLVHWLCGRAPLRVTAQAAAGLSALPEDSAVATLRLRGGSLCTLAASHVASGNVLTLHGTDGMALVTDDQVLLRGRFTLNDRLFDYGQAGAVRAWTRGDLEPALAARADGLELHGRFARWIDDLDDFPCPGDVAAEDLRTLDAIDRVRVTERSEPV